MTRKNKTLRLIVSFTLVLMLIFSLVPSIFAADYAEAADEDNPAEGAVTKVLKMPAGTELPDYLNLTFVFEFEPLNVDGTAYNPTTPNMPIISDMSVEFDGTESDESTVPGILEYHKESGNFIYGVSFPQAGVYTYKVTEKANTNILVPADPVTEETVTYSLGEYEIEVWVDNHSNGGTYVRYIVAKHIKEDDGTATPGTVKVDPTLGGDQTTYFESQMMFTNIYTKKIDDGPDPEEGALVISKTVKGDFADLSTSFPFFVTVTKPAIGVAGTPTFTAKVLNSDGSVKIALLTFTSGVAQTVPLAHGEKLVFAELYVGSSVKATETVFPNYTPAYVLDPSITVTSITGNPYGFEDAYLPESGLLAAFMNTFEKDPPSGLKVENLPYIVVIGVAVLSLIAFIVIKSRRNARYSVR